MGYPKKLLSDDEVIVTEFRPHWSGILKEGLLIFLALVLIVLIQLNGWPWWISVALIIGAILLAAEGLIRWLFTNHVITNERVIYRAGLISKVGKEIPHEVINDVSFRQSVVERIFGTGDLLIESAGTHGQSRYSDIPNPEGVQTIIYAEREKRMHFMNRASPDVGASTTASQLDTLARLHDLGKLTDAEFESEKKKLLGGA
ncbi:MAG: hypothetical protein DWQ40_02975 [Actinobacteria bacterium]|nr:MAG: hypothetical protein DWQ40_02975 [Actinomycetota bacterium]REK37778.1 MAG: hypothetical protein DWQ20_04470 [Actinomycetota bacterium]